VTSSSGANELSTLCTGKPTIIGWGHFFKGFCATEIQSMVNTQRKAPLNRFKQLWWTSEVIQCVWDYEAEHWKTQNGNKHGHTPAETNSNKREDLLAIARDLIQTQQLPPRYKKTLKPGSIQHNKQPTTFST
jgi:hypothetical protein